MIPVKDHFEIEFQYAFRTVFRDTRDTKTVRSARRRATGPRVDER